MVLQRDTEINLWGWADPGEMVILLFQGTKLTAKTGKDGKWIMILPPHPAGGPYEMTIKGKNEILIRNILVGDVWLASGQSNMEWILKNINNSEKEIGTASYDQIRLFTVTKKLAFQPKEELSSEGWKICAPESAENFSAIAYLFGRELHLRYGVPIGLINSSWGGTPAESWTSAEGLSEFPEFTAAIEELSRLDLSAIEAFQEKLNAWNKEFGGIDRGRLPGMISWTDNNLNTDDWLRVVQPGLWSTHKELKGFSGTIWFRKEIDIPVELSGSQAELHFGGILWADSAFFNGQFVGNTMGHEKKRVYPVPGNLVKTGRNIITMRITGVSSFGGMMGPASELYLKAGDRQISLAGEWLCKTAPDLSTYPESVALTGFNPSMPVTPTVLYNAMIAPLIPYAIKGVIWYQGESNADSMEEALQYYSLFPAMIEDWRRHWGYDFPFLFVQLAGYQADNPEPGDYPWAHLREAQSRTLALPNTGMAVAIDIGDQNDIHPRNKQDVARRLALAAYKIVYGEMIVHSGPTFKSMTVEGGRVRLSCDNTGKGLLAKDKYGYIRGFAIAGADRKFVWAKAYKDGDDVIVFSESIANPVAVRYNWGNTPDGNLYNSEDLPAVPYRSDDW